jgi:hypothetical protein
MKQLQILTADLLSEYISATSSEILTTAYNDLSDAPLSTQEFSFYTSVASVYSSKIEGATIELDSYVKHKRFGIEFEPDYTRKIDDLYLAYEFAQNQIPNKVNISQAHTILAKHIVTKTGRGNSGVRICMLQPMMGV